MKKQTLTLLVSSAILEIVSVLLLFISPGVINQYSTRNITQSTAIIGGADGPTAIFIAGKAGVTDFIPSLIVGGAGILLFLLFLTQCIREKR